MIRRLTDCTGLYCVCQCLLLLLLSFIFSINLLQDIETVILITIKKYIIEKKKYIYIYKIEEKFLSIKIYNNKTLYIKI
jgi:hypothetical protein